MAILRISRGVLEHMLDLPEGIEITGATFDTDRGGIIGLELRGGGVPEDGDVEATFSESAGGVVSLIDLKPV